LTGRTRGLHALCDSVSDVDIRRVDDRRRSKSRTSTSCTPRRFDFLLSAKQRTEPITICMQQEKYGGTINQSEKD